MDWVLSERKVKFSIPEKSKMEKEIEIIEMKVNSCEFWTKIALKEKLKHAAELEKLSAKIESSFVNDYAIDVSEQMHEMKTALSRATDILNLWIKIHKERKEKWLSYVGLLAIKKATINSSRFE